MAPKKSQRRKKQGIETKKRTKLRQKSDESDYSLRSASTKQLITNLLIKDDTDKTYYLIDLELAPYWESMQHSQRDKGQMITFRKTKASFKQYRGELICSGTFDMCREEFNKIQEEDEEESEDEQNKENNLSQFPRQSASQVLADKVAHAAEIKQRARKHADVAKQALEGSPSAPEDHGRKIATVVAHIEESLPQRSDDDLPLRYADINGTNGEKMEKSDDDRSLIIDEVVEFDADDIESNSSLLLTKNVENAPTLSSITIEQSNEVRVNGSQQKEREGQPIVMISPIVDVDTQQQQETKDAIKTPKVNKSSLIIATPRSGSSRISYFLAKGFVGYFISTILETSVSAQTDDESRGARLDSGFEKMSSFQTPNRSGTISEQPSERTRPPAKIYSISKPGKKLNFSLLVDGSDASPSSHPMKQLKDQYNDLYVEHLQLQNKYGKLLDDYNLLRANTLPAPNVEAIEWICELRNFFVREKVTPEQLAEFEQLLGLDSDLLLHSCQKRSITSAAREIFRRTHPDKEKRKKIQPTDVSTVYKDALA
ncbi:unnamed protein product, partial [Didymodactylos carnosus]